MNRFAGNEITTMQYICLNSGIQMSVFFLAMPRILAEKAGTDGWIALIIGWIITAAASLIVIQVMKKHPDGTLLDLLTRYLGKWTGKVAAGLFALYLFYYAYTGIAQALLITKAWLLPQTSASTVMLLLLIPTYVIARDGLRMLDTCYLSSSAQGCSLAEFVSLIKRRVEARIFGGSYNFFFLYWICYHVYLVSVFAEQTKGFKCNYDLRHTDNVRVFVYNFYLFCLLQPRRNSEIQRTYGQYFGIY
jgi:hypothetical protein